MMPILKSESTNDGVEITTFSRDNTAITFFFGYADILSMGVNCADLINHPDYYGYDPGTHSIRRTDFCTHHPD
ncbi:MAG: hypothetical protein JXA44_14025 [Methanospirillaceae archaeon]|nr:hypothetical protein [Methanospirillaceae archaeon]